MRNKNSFIKIFLNFNYFFYFKNISICNLKKNYNYFFDLNFYIFNINNINIKKIFLKTYTGDFFKLYFLKNNFILKVNDKLNCNNFIEILNHLNISFLEKIYFFLKKIFFKNSVVFNIGPSFKFFFYYKNFNKKFISCNLFLNEFIDNKIIYYFINFNFYNEKNIFFNIPTLFKNFLKFNFYLNNYFFKIFYLKKIINKNNLNINNLNLLKYVKLKSYNKINLHFNYFFLNNFKFFFYKNFLNLKKINYFFFLNLKNICKKNFILIFLGKDYFIFFLFLIIFFFLICFFFKLFLDLIYV